MFEKKWEKDEEIKAYLISAIDNKLEKLSIVGLLRIDDFIDKIGEDK